MKRTRRMFLILTLLLIGAIGHATTRGADADALDAVQDYLGALVAGDVERVRSNLGAALSQQRSALLANPDYPESLRRAYADARFRVTHSEQIAPDRARVDAQLFLGGNQILNVQFVLEAQGFGYKIVYEN
ncbi:MAG: hypothetical protein QGI81_16640 [Pseudomonadales bacterium]|nr:hypothetical protein [Pseudomonadales bacterium]